MGFQKRKTYLHIFIIVLKVISFIMLSWFAIVEKSRCLILNVRRFPLNLCVPSIFQFDVSFQDSSLFWPLVGKDVSLSCRRNCPVVFFSTVFPAYPFLPQYSQFFFFFKLVILVRLHYSISSYMLNFTQ